MRHLLLVIVLAAAITSMACGHAPTDTQEGHGDPGATHIGPPAVHNDADLAFARNMLPHHQQGVELAAMVPTHTANPDMRVIAAHIGADQQAEIGTLNVLLAQWHDTAHQGGAGHTHHQGMPTMGMVDQSAIDELESLHGAAFDTLWAVSMIGHHQGAVTMAQDEIAHGRSADAIQVARLIVEAQQREIAIMTHLISATQ